MLADDWQHSGLGSFASAVAVFERYSAARAKLLAAMTSMVDELRDAPELLEQIAENYRQTEWANEISDAPPGWWGLMDTETHDVVAVARGAEPEPLWAEVVDRVICDGRPGYLRDAADRYELLLRRMHDEATSMEDELAELAQSWDGLAFAAYHGVIEAVVAQTREAATAARAIVDALRLAADLLRGHQERIPIPVRLGNAVFRAHQQRRDSAGGVAPSNADFEQAVHADVVEREPWLTAPQALEQANILFLQQQNIARRIYRELSAAYNAVAELLPALAVAAPTASVVAPAPVEVTHGKGHGRSRTHHDLDHDVDRADDRDVDMVEVSLIDVDEDGVIDLPVPVALGGHDSDSLTTGHRSGYGNGPTRGAGPSDTGAAFGVPVSVMNAPSMNTGMGMGTPGMGSGIGGVGGIGTPGMSTPGMTTPGVGSGMGTHMGTHMSTPMGSGYGSVIGGLGEGDNNTWLTDQGDDPTEQDGHSSGAVLS